jgi:hypothetical protein
MVLDGEGADGEGKVSAGGGKGQTGLVVEAVSISGVTELVPPWQLSAMAVFRSIKCV